MRRVRRWLQLSADIKQVLDSQTPGNDNDQINIVVFNVKYNSVNHISEVAKRSVGNVLIDLPNGWEPGDTHFWVYFSSYTLQMNSESVYLQSIK